MAQAIHSPNKTYSGRAEFGGGLVLEFRDGVAYPRQEISEGHLRYLQATGYEVTEDAPEDAETTAVSDPDYDPDNYPVAEVIEYLDQATDAERQRVLEVEARGQDRKGIREYKAPAEGGETE